MSGQVTHRMIVLFPTELRDTARALKALREAPDGEKLPLLRAFLDRATLAFWHLMLDDADSKYLMLGAEPLNQGQPEDTGEKTAPTPEDTGEKTAPTPEEKRVVDLFEPDADPWHSVHPCAGCKHTNAPIEYCRTCRRYPGRPVLRGEDTVTE